MNNCGSLDEELYTRIRNNEHVDRIRDILNSGANPCAKVSDGNTVLGSAVQNGNWSLVLSLIQWIPRFKEWEPTVRCSVNCKDHYKRTALHYAAEAGSTELVSLLLGAGANINADDHEKLTPLHLAAGSGWLSVVRSLLRFGCKPNPTTDRCYEKVTPLHIAVSCGFTEIVLELVENGAQIDPLDYKEQTPLFLAVTRNRVDIVRILLTAGANPNISQINDYNSLTEAVGKGNGELVELLLSSGATASVSHNLLHQAISGKFEDIALLLIQYGFSVAHRNMQGWTPLHLACRFGYPRIVHRLLEYGADPNDRHAVSGDTPIFCAIRAVNANEPRISQEDCIGILALLTEYGAELEMSVGGLFTPLGLALSADQLEVAQKLLQLGADPNNPQSHIADGLSSLFHNYGISCVQMLLSAGLRIDVTPPVDEELQAIFHLYRLPPLKYICQQKLRRVLLSAKPFELIENRIAALPLPPIMKAYLSLDVFD